jgi:spore germination protein GerM
MRDSALVPVKASATDLADPARTIGEVLAQLAEGPSEADRSAGLSTALGLDTVFRLAGFEAGVARIDIAAGEQLPSSSRVPLAVAQVVLTATSVPGVDSVLISRDGTPVELPLPGGALTAGPVTGRDYAELVTSPTVSGSSTPSATPTAG